MGKLDSYKTIASETSTAPSVADRSARAEFLCVDLDGTILMGDSLWESLLALIGRHPWYLFVAPIWALKGRAALKSEIAARVSLNVSTLPVRAELIEFLRQEKLEGKKLVLATGAHHSLATAVADHFGIFDRVLASDNATNLTGDRKRNAIESLANGRDFDYIGNSRADLPIWKAARTAILVNPGPRLLKAARRTVSVGAVFEKPKTSRASAWKALRPQHWVKNFLVFLPMIMAHDVRDISMLTRAFVAFVSFSLCASAVYLFNDLCDLEADRLHPTKRFRPFASGETPLWVGISSVPVLLVCSLFLAYLLPSGRFLLVLIGYMLTTTLYSTYLKRTPIVDVLVLTGLYLLRILAGGVATGVSISPWLLSFSMFLLLSLAFAKRHAELIRTETSSGSKQVVSKRNYLPADVAVVLQFGVTSGLLSVLVLALYLNSREVSALYRHPLWIWLACPLLLFWVCRLWFIACRGELHEDPVVFAVHDRVSHVLGIMLVVILFAAA